MYKDLAREEPGFLSDVNALAAEHDEDPVTQTIEMPTVLAEQLLYGPDCVRGLFGSRRLWRGLSGMASFGGFSFGYDQGVISVINVMDVMDRFLRDQLDSITVEGIKELS